MNCKNVRELLPLFVGRDLDEKRASLVSSHMQNCVECAGAADEYRASREILQQFAPPQFSEAVYDGIRQRVLTEIARDSTAPARSGLLASLFRPPMKWAVACGLLLAVAGFSLYLIAGRTNERHLTSKKAPPAPSVQSNASPASSPVKPNNRPTQTIDDPHNILSDLNPPAFHQPRPNRRKNSTVGIRPRAVDTVTSTQHIASMATQPSRQINNIAEPKLAPAPEAETAEKPLRVEIQTRDQNIRIIWFSHHPTKKNSPGKSSKHAQEARSNA